MAKERKPSLDYALREFLLEGKARQFTPATLAHYRGRLGEFLRFAADQDVTTVGDVTPTLLRAYLVRLQERGLASNTQHTHARAVRAFLNFCKREGLIAVSPFDKVKMPKAAKVEKKALTADQVRRLVRACDKPRDLALLLTALDTGARASEICALNAGDVDLDTLAVRAVQGKGRKDRTVYVGARAGRAVSRYLGSRVDVAATAPLFTSEAPGNLDGRLTRSGLRRILQRLGAAAGVEGVHPHKLRRTFAVTCLRGGMDVYTLARLMGHAGIDTLRDYVASIGDELQLAHGKVSPVDRLFKK